MQHFLSENNLPNLVDCIVIGVVDDESINPAIIQKNANANALFNRVKKQFTQPGDWYSSIDTTSTFVVYYLGENEKLTLTNYKSQLVKLANSLKTKPWKSISLYLPQTKHVDDKNLLLHTILSFEDAYYQFLNYKENKELYSLQNIYYGFSHDKKTLNEAIAIAAGFNLCKNLANMPANDCNPVFLEDVAKNLSLEFKHLKFNSLDVPEMKKLGMNTLLSVGQGSDNPPRLIELHHLLGNKNQKPLILIGKGITFDSGGISLKPPESMNEMKYDMSGAASVLGVMKAISILKLPINVIGIMACAENMPSGKATRPGDVVKSLAGKTIEITNTDAEGRLVLADAISYVQKYQPEAMVDIATLTGAIIIALGHVYTGLLSNNEKLANELLETSKKTNDKVWRLPLDDEYQEALDSPVADMVNSPGSRVAGSIVAAQFLNIFTNNIPWAHLDIAGSAWVPGKNNHSTGRPVHLLIDWLKNYKYEN